MNTIAIEEVQKHNKKDDIWVAIHGKVYNVTNFINEHPGGPEVILEQAAFDDIGHSDVAHDLMEEYRVGNLGTAEKAAAAAARKPRSPITQRSTCSSLTTWIPAALLGAAVAGLLAYHYSSR